MRPVHSLISLLLCVLLFALWPDVDLRVSGWFYDPSAGFFLKNQTWAVRLYDLFAQVHWVILGGLMTILFFPQWQQSALRLRLRRQAIYLLLVLLLGPGLLVNSGFKEHWGRARPHQVTAFGGTQVHSDALTPTNQCQGNCSFVSGHAAMGFFMVAGFFASGRRRWLVAGLLTGSVVGLARIVQGDHYLSDVVFAFWSVWLVAWALAAVMAIKPRS